MNVLYELSRQVISVRNTVTKTCFWKAIISFQDGHNSMLEEEGVNKQPGVFAEEMTRVTRLSTRCLLVLKPILKQKGTLSLIWLFVT